MDTEIKKVGILPLVKYSMEKLGLARLFDKYVPDRNEADIPPSQVLCMMVTNIMVSAAPLYRVEDWLHAYLDGPAEPRVDAAKYKGGVHLSAVTATSCGLVIRVQGRHP